MAIFQQAYSQNVFQCINMADQLFAKDSFIEAGNIYQRVIFFSHDSINADLFYKLAECYFYQRNYEEALVQYDLAYNNIISDSLRNEILFRKAMIYTLQKNYLLAHRELLDISMYDTATVKRYYFYDAIIAFRQNYIDSSKRLFILALPFQKDSLAIIKIFENAQINGKPNPNTALFLSILMPGLGQLYSGDIKNAANSFILNTILAGTFLFISVKYGLLDAGLTVFPWFQRYYFGGFNRAREIAKKRQQIKKEMLLQNVIIFSKNLICN